MGSAALTHAVLGQGPKIQRYVACHLQWPGRKRISRRELETRLSWECLSPAKPGQMYPHLSQNAQNLQMSCAQNHIKNLVVPLNSLQPIFHIKYAQNHRLGHFWGGMVLGFSSSTAARPTADPLVIDLGAEKVNNEHGYRGAAGVPPGNHRCFSDATSLGTMKNIPFENKKERIQKSISTLDIQ